MHSIFGVIDDCRHFWWIKYKSKLPHTGNFEVADNKNHRLCILRNYLLYTHIALLLLCIEISRIIFRSVQFECEIKTDIITLKYVVLQNRPEPR